MGTPFFAGEYLYIPFQLMLRRSRCAPPSHYPFPTKENHTSPLPSSLRPLAAGCLSYAFPFLLLLLFLLSPPSSFPLAHALVSNPPSWCCSASHPPPSCPPLPCPCSSSFSFPPLSSSLRLLPFFRVLLFILFLALALSPFSLSLSFSEEEDEDGDDEEEDDEEDDSPTERGAW